MDANLIQYSEVDFIRIATDSTPPIDKPVAAYMSSNIVATTLHEPIRKIEDMQLVEDTDRVMAAVPDGATVNFQPGMNCCPLFIPDYERDRCPSV